MQQPLLSSVAPAWLRCRRMYQQAAWQRRLTRRLWLLLMPVRLLLIVVAFAFAFASAAAAPGQGGAGFCSGGGVSVAGSTSRPR